MKRSKKDYRVYLQDILFAISRIQLYAKQGKKKYMTDGLLQDGIIRQVSIVGEAATKLPAAWKADYPDIPWKQITGMRNILIHDYSEINLDRVWIVAKEDLPPLKKTIEAMSRNIEA